MATPPTVLAGASSVPSSTPAHTPVAASGKSPIVPMLIAVVLGILIAGLGFGGIAYFLVRSGRMPLRGGQQAKAEPAPVGTHIVELEPLLVNLADESGSAYLKVGIALRVVDATTPKDSKSKEEKPKGGGDDVVAEVRDTTLTVLGRQTVEGLLAVDGKEHLKSEIKSALAKHNTDLRVTDVFFTDFLVQR